MGRPTIRRAKFGDIDAICRLIIEMHARSRYAEIAKVDERRAKALLMQCLQRGASRSNGGAFVAVADTGKSLEGFVLAVLQPLYMILDVLEATDVFWYASPGANAATGTRLLKAMHRWAPDGTIIRQATTDAIVDPKRSGRLLAQRDMRLVGYVYEKEKLG